MAHNDVINDDVTYLTLDDVFDDNETSSDDEVVRPDWNIVSNFLDHSTQYRSSTSLVMVLVYNLPSRERNLIFLFSVLIWVRPDTIRICSSSSSRGRFSFRGASSRSHKSGHLEFRMNFTWFRNILIVLMGIFSTYRKSVTNRKNWFWYNWLFHQENLIWKSKNTMEVV